MKLLLSGLVAGLVLGGLYATAALGLSLVYGVLGLVNLAHGEIMILAAYLTYVLGTTWHLDPLLALVLVVPLMFLFGWALQWTFLNRLLARGSLEAGLVTTLGLSLVIQTLLLQGFSSDAKTFTPSYISRGTTVAGITIPNSYLLCLFVAVAVTLGVHSLIHRTSFGRQARATAEDVTTARLMGIRVQRVYGTMFGLGAAVSAVAGVLVGVAFSFTPGSGVSYLLKGFAVVVLGGMGSILGTLAGGLLLGGLEGVGANLFGGGYRDLVAYLGFLVILLLAPHGLFARRARA